MSLNQALGLIYTDEFVNHGKDFVEMLSLTMVICKNCKNGAGKTHFMLCGR